MQLLPWQSWISFHTYIFHHLLKVTQIFKTFHILQLFSSPILHNISVQLKYWNKSEKIQTHWRQNLLFVRRRRYGDACYWFSSVALYPTSDQNYLLFEVSRPHTIRHTHTHTHTHTRAYIRQDSSERVISLSKRSLPTQHTTNIKEEYSWPQPDSNPPSQYESGSRPTP